MATPPATTSLRLLAAGMVVGFCYWASPVLIVIVLSVLMAQLLEPCVQALERVRLPRAAGALLMTLVALALVAAIGIGIWTRVESFESDWPRYRAVLRQATSAIELRLSRFERRVSEITPPTPGQPPPVVTVESGGGARKWLYAALGSLYEAIVAASFVPLLAFFMLARKPALLEATVALAPRAAQDELRLALDEVSVTLRSFVLGTLAAALVLGLLSGGLFWALGLDYPFLGGLASGALNLVPYLGPFLASVPPALTGLARFNSVGPLLGIIGCILVLHLLSINLLTPALIGRSVRLNAFAATLALLFWGFLWGGIGFVLAIPVTATIRVACDHIPAWKPIGRWLG